MYVYILTPKKWYATCTLKVQKVAMFTDITLQYLGYVKLKVCPSHNTLFDVLSYYFSWCILKAHSNESSHVAHV